MGDMKNEGSNIIVWVGAVDDFRPVPATILEGPLDYTGGKVYKVVYGDGSKAVVGANKVEEVA